MDPAVGIAIERAQIFAASRSDVVVTLVGSDASLENFVALIRYFEENGIAYSIYGFSHGILDENRSIHGVIMYGNGSQAVVVNGEILHHYIGVARWVREFVWVACSIEDEYELYREESFAGFFANAIDFRIYGRGETDVPQELLDYFGSVLTEYSEVVTYPVVITGNGTIVEGELEIVVNATIEYVEIETYNATFGLHSGSGSKRYVKRYRKTVRVRVYRKVGARYGKRTYGKKPPSAKTVTFRSKISYPRISLETGTRDSAGTMRELREGMKDYELLKIDDYAKHISTTISDLQGEFEEAKTLATLFNFDASRYSGMFNAKINEIRELAKRVLSTDDYAKKEELYNRLKEAVDKAGEIVKEFRSRVIQLRNRKLNRFKRMIDDSIYTREELRKIVITWFTSAKERFKEGIHEIIALIIPRKIYVLGAEIDNPTYYLVCSIADGHIEQEFGAGTLFANWLMQNDRFRIVANIMLKGMEARWNTLKVIIGLMIYKFLGVVKDILSWLGTTIDWFIYSMASALGLPRKLADILKAIKDGIIQLWATVINNMYAFLEGELSAALKDVDNFIVGAIIQLHNMFKDVQDTIMEWFRTWIILVVNSFTQHLYMQMVGSSIDEEENYPTKEITRRDIIGYQDYDEFEIVKNIKYHQGFWP